MKQLEPLILKQDYFDNIEDEINRIFFEVIYAPILAEIKIPKKEISNEGGIIADALRSGRVYIKDNRVYGSFNSKLSRDLRRIGASFNSASKTWTLPDNVPTQIHQAAAVAKRDYEIVKQSVITAIDNINPTRINELSAIPDEYYDTLTRIDEDFRKTAKRIEIPAKMTDEQKNVIAAEWSQNLDLYIKEWTDENILKLRETIEKETFGSGLRAESLISDIRKNYGVSKRKAKFLARQETSLLLSKYRETRYTNMGINRYIWRGAMDSRERHDHKILEGKIISWDNPPVVDLNTGRRAHAGEDFGCRCVAVPLVE
jgi:SPP1 gp7 family putative phage head morphogenesis protein